MTTGQINPPLGEVDLKWYIVVALPALIDPDVTAMIGRDYVTDCERVT